MLRSACVVLILLTIARTAFAQDEDQRLFGELRWQVHLNEVGTQENWRSLYERISQAGYSPIPLNEGNGIFTFWLGEKSFPEGEGTNAQAVVNKLVASEVKASKSLQWHLKSPPETLLESYIRDETVSDQAALRELVPKLRFGVWIGDVNPNDDALLAKLRVAGYEAKPAADKFSICPAIFVAEYEQEFEARFVRDHLAAMGFRMPFVALTLPEPDGFHYTEENSKELIRIAELLKEQDLKSESNSFTKSLPADYRLQSIVYYELCSRFPVEVTFVFAGAYDNISEAEKAQATQIGGHEFPIVSLWDDGNWQLFAKAFIGPAEANQYVEQLKKWGFPNAHAYGTTLGHREYSQYLSK